MDTAATLIWVDTRRAVSRWLRQNFPRAIVMSAVSFVVGWLLNVWLLAVRYEGFAVPPGTKKIATGQGTMVAGSVFWAAVSSAGFALFFYTRKVGIQQVLADVRQLPATIRRTLQGPDRDRAAATLAWGAAVSLFVAVVIGPGAAGVVAVTMTVFAATPLGQLVAGVVHRLWMVVLNRLNPTAGQPMEGVRGAILASAGTAVGMLVAFLVTGTSTKVLLAAVGVAVAFVLANREVRVSPGTTVLVFLVGLVAFEFLEAATAFADDGGWVECGSCSLVEWVASGGAAEVLTRGAAGGVAAAVGAPVGAALGEILADGSPDGGGTTTPEPDRGQTPDPDGSAEPEPGDAGPESEDAVPQSPPDESRGTSPTDDIPPKPTGPPPKPAGPPPSASDRTPAPATVAAAATAAAPAATTADTADARPASPLDGDAMDPAVIAAKREQLIRDQQAAEEANSWWGWGRNVVAGTLSGIWDEATEVPGQVADAAKATLEVGAKVIDEVKDPENWRVAAEGTAQTIYDVATLVTPGSDSSEAEQKIMDGIRWTHDRVEDAGTLAGTLYAAAEEDPAGAARAVAEVLLSKENWDKAMDPDVPLLDRAGHAVWGAIETTMTLGGFGAGGLAAADKVGDMVRAAEALDTGLDAARTGAVLDDVARAAARGVDGAAPPVVRVADTVEDIPSGGRTLSRADAAQDRLRSMEEGAIIDNNLLPDTGYTGRQIHGDGNLVKVERPDGTEVDVHERMGMVDIAKKHDAVIETRTTNADSMRRIRDGEAVPKDLSIKPKTVKDVDTTLGYRPEDKGLVAYRQPGKPSRADFPDQAAYGDALERFKARDTEFRDKSFDMFKLEQEGKVFVDRRTGVVYDVQSKKPYAGDIDAVMFRNADGTPVDRTTYERIRQDWTDPKNAVMGQHGAEHQVVNDVMTEVAKKHPPGSAEYNARLDDVIELQRKLEKAHTDEVVVRVGPDGILRRGPSYRGALPADVDDNVRAMMARAREAATENAAREAAAAAVREQRFAALRARRQGH